MGGNFRTALNGFNRADVVNYMEECAISYERSLKKLRQENDQLRAEVEELRAALAAQPPAPAPVPEPEPEPIPAPPAEAMPGELEAYRRAEAVEREARRRAARLGDQVNQVISDALRQFETAGADADTQMTDLSLCLRRLNDTLASLRLTFDGVSKSLETFRKEKN